MLPETVDDLYQAINKMPKEERLRLAVRVLNDVAAQLSVIEAAPSQAGNTERVSPADEPSKMPEWARFLLESAKKIEEEEDIELPSDFAEQHDHYLYGTPKR